MGNTAPNMSKQYADSVTVIPLLFIMLPPIYLHDHASQPKLDKELNSLLRLLVPKALFLSKTNSMSLLCLVACIK